MDWVKKFYSTQNNWFDIYLGDIEDSHYLRADLVNNLTNQEEKKILELGAGGGQTAIALAELGHQLTSIELLEESVAHAKELAHYYATPMQIIQGDFYTVPLPQKFDIVCYFDSFGIGSDQDQILLLQRISEWLQPDGCAIIEIGSTWYWGGIGHNKTLDLGDGSRHYSFDAITSRLVDKWWQNKQPENSIYQYLRCYTPADLQLLLRDTGLKLEQIEAGGKIDYQQMKFIPKVPLSEAMTYYVKLVKT